MEGGDHDHVAEGVERTVGRESGPGGDSAAEVGHASEEGRFGEEGDRADDRRAAALADLGGDDGAGKGAGPESGNHPAVPVRSRAERPVREGRKCHLAHCPRVQVGGYGDGKEELEHPLRGDQPAQRRRPVARGPVARALVARKRADRPLVACRRRRGACPRAEDGSFFPGGGQCRGRALDCPHPGEGDGRGHERHGVEREGGCGTKPEVSALLACRSSAGSREGTIAKEPGRNSPSPAPRTAAMGTST